MKKTVAHILSKGGMLLLLAAVSEAMAGVEYKVEWDDNAERYRVYMRPSATPVPDLTLSAQVTLRVPYLSATNRFVVDDLISIHAPGATWSDSSKVAGPIEAPNIEYISFTPTISDASIFRIQRGVEQEIFSFRNAGNACLGTVEIMNNETDPFNQPNGATSNSAGTNPGNEFSSISWPESNDFTGIYGGVAKCNTLSTPENNNPIANNDSMTVDQNNPIIIDVMGNDSDSDGDTLIVESFTQGGNGSVTMSNNNLMYTPSNSYSGTDSFMYTISDGNGGTSTATVSLIIGEAPTSNDNDNDGLTNTEEALLGTDPNNPDSDYDGINDKVEVGNNLNYPADTDNDGIIDALDVDNSSPVLVNTNSKPIPTLTEWAQILLSLLLGAIALRRFIKS